MSDYNQKGRILVVGRGIVGLNTALRLQEDFPSASIDILGKTTGLVSHVAAGFFRPSKALRGPSPQVTKEWLQFSWDFYNNLLDTEPRQETGLVEVRPLHFASIDAAFDVCILGALVHSSLEKCASYQL